MSRCAGISAWLMLVLAASAIDTRAAWAQDSTGLRIRRESPRWVGSLGDEDGRLVQLVDSARLSSRMLRPLTVDSTRGPGGPQLVLYHPQVRGTWNSAVPFGMNDGALWAGRGLSAMVEVGAELRWQILTARFAPSFSASQNAGFPLAPLQFSPPNASPFADQWWSERIDRPQRFGENALSQVSLGQSVVRIDWRGGALGISTENMWWGPGIDNAIMMTNSAEGFPHAFIGTSHPVNIWIGHLEGMYLAGRLYDSDFWRTSPDTTRNRRWLGALAAVLEPRGARGLYLGFARVFYEYLPPEGLDFGDILTVFQPFPKKSFATPTNPNGDDIADQMVSLFARWVFPSTHFEVYGEWGRNDHSWDMRDFILEPDHASGFLLGFQKVFMQPSGRSLAVRGEMTALAAGRTAQLRASPPWYAHHIVRQGYTHEGQLLGAGIGPGSDMQKLAADWRDGRWMAGAFVERIRWDSDGFYRFYGPQGTAPSNHRNHDVTFGAGLRGRLSVGRVEAQLQLFHAGERNRYSVLRNDVGNLNAELRAEFRP